MKPALFNIPRPNDDASIETFGVNTEESNKRSVTPEKDPLQPRKAKKIRVIGSDVIMNQIHGEDVGELTDDDDELMDTDEVTVNTLTSRMQSIETSVQNINDNIALTIQAQFAQFFKNNNLNNTPGIVSPSPAVQSTPNKEGTQSEASLAHAGGVDC